MEYLFYIILVLAAAIVVLYFISRHYGCAMKCPRGHDCSANMYKTQKYVVVTINCLECDTVWNGIVMYSDFKEWEEEE